MHMTNNTAGVRKAVAVGGTALIAGAAALTASPAAAAVPDFTGPTTGYVTDLQGGQENGTMYGAYIVKDGPLKGQRVWCIDAGLDWPVSEQFTSSNQMKTKKATELGYILSTYDIKRGSVAEQAEWDMAISSFVKASKEINHRHIVDVYAPINKVNKGQGGPGWNHAESKIIKAIGKDRFDSETVPNAQKHYQEIADAVKKYAGTYKAEINLAEAGTGAELSFRVASSTGNALPGLPATIKLTGGTFADGSTEKKVKTGDSWVKETVNATGDVKAHLKVDNVPSDQVEVWTPKDFKSSGYDRYDTQEVVKKVKPRTLEAQTQLAGYTPEITTLAQDQVTTLDDNGEAQIADRIKITGGQPGSKMTITTTAHGPLATPPAEGEPTPEDAPVVGSVEVPVELDDKGEALVTSDSITVTESGYYWFTYSSDGGGRTPKFEDNRRYEDETTLVKWAPEIETKASHETSDSLPLDVHDTGVITGGKPGAKLTVSTEAFFEPGHDIEQTAQAPDNAQSLGVTVAEVVLDDNGEARYETDPLGLTEDLVAAGEKGAVVFQVTVAEDDEHVMNVDDYGVPAETILIDIPAPGETPKPSPKPSDEPKAGGHAVSTGGYVDGGANLALIVGGIAIAAAGAGGVTYLIRRRINQS